MASMRWLAAGLLLLANPAEARESATDRFAAVSRPSATRPQVVGEYTKGCLAGGVPLAQDTPGWQVMRPSRNRFWGHPELIAFLGRLATSMRAEAQPGLLVGDLGQPRGGPMRSGHASHQIGLDADIWLAPMPRQHLSGPERETMFPASMLKPDSLHADPARLGPYQQTLIRSAAKDPAVARVFVHPGIKEALCARTLGERSWLAKVRPWYGHDEHIHVRLHCPRDQPLCREQAPPPAGNGCEGPELAWWFGQEPWAPKDTLPKPRREVAMSELPSTCEAVLKAP